MRGRIFIFCLFAAACISAAACGSSANDGITGKIVIYTSMYEDVIETVQEKLDKEFRNADIELFYGSTAELQQKVENELAEGQLGCDMLMVADPAYSLELKDRGLLHQYKYPDTAKLDFEHDADGYWYPVRISNMVLAYNPELMDKDAAPSSFYDFAYSEDLKGKVAMPNPLTAGTAMTAIAALSEKYGYEYFDALKEQGVHIGSSSLALTGLEEGTYGAVMVLEEVALKRREEEDSAVEIIYPSDGTICIPSSIMTISEEKSPHKSIAAAEAITKWFLSDEGQDYIVDGWMHSVITDFPRHPKGAAPTNEILANIMPVSWEACFRDKDGILKKFNDQVPLIMIVEKPE